jgi:hypothetical protein
VDVTGAVMRRRQQQQQEQAVARRQQQSIGRKDLALDSRVHDVQRTRECSLQRFTTDDAGGAAVPGRLKGGSPQKAATMASSSQPISSGVAHCFSRPCTKGDASSGRAAEHEERKVCIATDLGVINHLHQITPGQVKSGPLGSSQVRSHLHQGKRLACYNLHCTDPAVGVWNPLVGSQQTDSEQHSARKFTNKCQVR